MNIVLYAHGLVSKQQPRPVRLWHKKSSVSPEAFFVYLFSLFFTLCLCDTMSRNAERYIPCCFQIMSKKYIPSHDLKLDCFDWPSMNEDFHKKKKSNNQSELPTCVFRQKRSLPRMLLNLHTCFSKHP